MMARNTKQPAPAPVAHAGTTPSLTLIENVADTLAPGNGKRKSLMAEAKAKLTEQVLAKVNVMSSVRQKLAEAKDLFDMGSGNNTQARAVANTAAVSLYQARCSGIFSKEEVSAALGDQFGFKPKGDGTPGKTPEGEGEAIRKRVVRATEARMHLETGDGGQFFNGLDADSANKDGVTLSDVVDRLDEGEYSIWTAYEKLAEIKRDNAEKTELAFDAKRIAGIVASLSQDGAVQKYRNDPVLVAAYAALTDILTVVDEAAASDTKAA